MEKHDADTANVHVGMARTGARGRFGFDCAAWTAARAAPCRVLAWYCWCTVALGDRSPWLPAHRAPGHFGRRTVAGRDRALGDTRHRKRAGARCANSYRKQATLLNAGLPK